MQNASLIHRLRSHSRTCSPRAATQRRLVFPEILEERELLAVNFVFDYSLDVIDKHGNGWFDSPERRNALETAGATIGSMLGDTLQALDVAGEKRTSGREVSWVQPLVNPSALTVAERSSSSCTKRVLGICTEESYTRRTDAVASAEYINLVDPMVPTNVVIVYVGVGRQSTGALASTYWVEKSRVLGDQAWQDKVQGRGQSGALGEDPSEFAPAILSISYNPDVKWDSSLDQPAADAYSLLSTTLHELGHVLGVGISNAWSRHIARDAAGNPSFRGPHAMQANGNAPVAVDAKEGHIDQSGTAFSPIGFPGSLILPTTLDAGVLRDLGWEISLGSGLLATSLSGRVTDPTGRGVGGVSIFASCESMAGGCPLLLAPVVVASTNANGFWNGTFDPDNIWDEGTWRLVAMFDGQDVESTDVFMANGRVTAVNYQLDYPVGLTGRLHQFTGNDGYLAGTNEDEWVRLFEDGGETEVIWQGQETETYSRSMRNPSDIRLDLGGGDDLVRVDLNRSQTGAWNTRSSVSIDGGKRVDGGDQDELVVFAPLDSRNIWPEKRVDPYDRIEVVIGGGELRVPAARLQAKQMERVHLRVKANEIVIHLADDQQHTVTIDIVEGERWYGTGQWLSLVVDGQLSMTLEPPLEHLKIHTAEGEIDWAVRDLLTDVNLINADNPVDVNRDGHVTPIDALHVVNYLNAAGGLEGRDLDVARFAAYLQDNKIDVTADGVVSPIDALWVVNHLNQSSRSAEGEHADEATFQSLAGGQSTNNSLTPIAPPGFSPLDRSQVAYDPWRSAWELPPRAFDQIANEFRSASLESSYLDDLHQLTRQDFVTSPESSASSSADRVDLDLRATRIDLLAATGQLHWELLDRVSLQAEP